MEEMFYRKLGSSGLQVSALSFGSWVTFGKQLDRSLVKDCIKYSFDCGINFFDNAEVYAHGKSEELMAQAFQDIGLSRNDYILTSKFFWGIENRINFKNTLNRKYLSQAIDGSLKRLRTDFIDVIYCHRYDPETPISEICFTMDQFIRAGKALYWGTSEWPAHAIESAYDFCIKNSLNPPIVEQPQYNLLFKDKVENEFSLLYAKMNLGLTIWSPLASGILTGKYMNGIPENSRASMPSLSFVKDEVLNPQTQKRVQKLHEVAQKSGLSMTHLALGWCLLNEKVSTVILGASQLDQLKNNLLTLKHLSKIKELYTELNRI